MPVEAVHLITSIPAEQYRSVDALPTGSTPSGSWLLFAYLRFAESLQQLINPTRVPASAGMTPEEDASIESDSQPAVYIRPSREASPLPAALGPLLAHRRGAPVGVFWGNDGFCVDNALHDPEHPEAAELGVLTDFARFGKAPDPVTWDLYRTAMLRGMGWPLHRVWSPLLFRDAGRTLEPLVEA